MQYVWIGMEMNLSRCDSRRWCFAISQLLDWLSIKFTIDYNSWAVGSSVVPRRRRRRWQTVDRSSMNLHNLCQYICKWCVIYYKLISNTNDSFNLMEKERHGNLFALFVQFRHYDIDDLHIEFGMLNRISHQIWSDWG